MKEYKIATQNLRHIIYNTLETQAMVSEFTPALEDEDVKLNQLRLLSLSTIQLALSIRLSANLETVLLFSN
jgi:hypothetical protein